MKTDGNTCACSNSRKDHKQTAIKDPPQKKYLGRSVEFIKMMVPAFAFAIIPKCPVCLAGYIALSTGIGLSITTATYVRMVLIFVCILSLVYFVLKHVRRFIVKW